MGNLVTFPLAARLLTPSDGQETVLCELCFATIFDAGQVVIFDRCDACEVAVARGVRCLFGGNEWADVDELVANDQAPERA